MKKNKTLIIFTMIILSLMCLTVICFADFYKDCHEAIIFTDNEGVTGYMLPDLSFDNNIVVNDGAFPLVAINGYEYVVDADSKIYYFYADINNDGDITGIRYVRSETFLEDNNLDVLTSGDFIFVNSAGGTSIAAGLNYNVLKKLRDSLGLITDGDPSLYTSRRITSSYTVCNLIERRPPYMTIITAITAVFTAVGTWFASIIPDMLALFFAEGELTILGALAVAALAIAVILLVLNWILDFFHFRR